MTEPQESQTTEEAPWMPGAESPDPESPPTQATAPTEPTGPTEPAPAPAPASVAVNAGAAIEQSNARPEIAVGAAFAGGFVAALILKRLAR